MGLKEVFLQKGWAGQTLSREETVERLNPLIRQHMSLNQAYAHAIDTCSLEDITQQLAAFQKTARMDTGKLKEVVYSCGGVAYNGVDLDPDEHRLSENDGPMLLELQDLEQAFLSNLAEELKREHQIRTKATLSIVHDNSKERLDYLKRQARQYRRQVS